MSGIRNRLHHRDSRGIDVLARVREFDHYEFAFGVRIIRIPQLEANLIDEVGRRASDRGACGARVLTNLARHHQKNAEPTHVPQVLTALAYPLYIQTTRPLAGSEAMPL